MFLSLTFICKIPYAQNFINETNLYLQEKSALESKTQLSKLVPDTGKISKPPNQKIKPVRLALVGGALSIGFTALHIYYSNTWWKEKRNYFKFAEDGYYARGVDRISHIYTANLATEVTSAAYEWVGLSPDKSLLYGAITAMAYETYVEINDGFAPNWGFDWIDMGANIFGVIYPVLQRKITPLENVNFKWSFNPKWLKGKLENTDDLLDDYTNMTFWLSINPEFLLPKSLTTKKFYPNFLSLALGLSIKNASHSKGSKNAYKEWFISLDYDLRKLPGKSEFLKKLKKILNFYHLPAPAVRISPSGIWYGLYF